MDSFDLWDASGTLAAMLFALALGGVWKILSEIRGHLVTLVAHVEALTQSHKDPRSMFSNVEVIKLLGEITEYLEDGGRLDQWTAKVLRELLIQAEVPAAKILELEKPGGV